MFVLPSAVKLYAKLIIFSITQMVLTEKLFELGRKRSLDNSVYLCSRKTITINIMAKIALGTWAWGSGKNGGDTMFGINTNAETLRPVFDAAMDAGLNVWDTAAVYGMGESERILGSFIKTRRRDDVVISTKFTPELMASFGNSMESMLESSLQRLGTDYIDIYWIHNDDDVEKWTPKLIPLLRSGKIHRVGVRNHTLDEVRRANEILSDGGYGLSAVQIHTSLLYRENIKNGLLDYCKQNGIEF